MAGVRLSLLKSLYRSTSSSCKPHSAQVLRPFSRLADYADLLLAKSSSMVQKKQPYASFNLLNSHPARSITCGNPLLHGVSHKPKPSPSPSIVSFSSNLRLHNNFKPFNYSIPFLGYSRAFSSKSDNFGSIVAPGVTGTGDGNDIDWVDKAKDVLQTSVDAVTETARKTKEASDEMIPHVHQFLHSNPYLKEVIVPISLTMTATLFAWVVMPRVLRRFHTYAMQSSAALLPGGFSTDDVPYEKSFWGALEDPARYLVTFIAFAQM